MNDRHKIRIVLFYFVTSVFSVSLVILTFHFWLKYMKLKNDSVKMKALITDKKPDPLTHGLFEYRIIYIISNDTIVNSFRGKEFKVDDKVNIVVYKKIRIFLNLSINIERKVLLTLDRELYL